MLHILTTTIFVAAGLFALSVIASMLFDGAPAIMRALGLRHGAATLPSPARRVRLVRTRRLSLKAPAPQRAAA
jgi:hypothetical protein